MKHRKRLQICISSETFSPETYNSRFTLPRYNAPKYSVFFEVPLMSNILRPLPCASRLMLLFTTLCALSACTAVKSAPPTPETTDTGAAPAVAAPQETPAALPAAAPAASTTSK
ncbi:MAG TPA: lytic transglycosylase, partial [Sutterella wadsworthensis]|nr:lytic transglycosylase [Sutterella wadsworthensis]